MLVVIVGSGGSRAVSDAYPTTVEFVAQLPAKMRLDDNSLLGRVHQALASEKNSQSVDVEEILGRLTALRRSAERVRADDLFEKTFRPNRGVAVPAPVGQWVNSLIELQRMNGFEDHIDELVSQLHERLWHHYSPEPLTEDLESTWMPLLHGLLALPQDIEIYTLNYDPVLDTALGHLPSGPSASHRIERGVYPAKDAYRVQIDHWAKSVDELRQDNPNYLLYTKLHGSLNWVRDGDQIVAGAWSQPPRDLRAAAIVYPELDKDASSEAPFREFYGRLQASIRMASHVVSVGYAHRDPPVERLLEEHREAPLIVLNPLGGLGLRLEERGYSGVTQIVEGLTHASGQQVLDLLASGRS